MTDTTGQQKPKKTMNGNLKWWAQWGTAGISLAAVMIWGAYPLFEDYREQQKKLTDQIPLQTVALQAVSKSLQQVTKLADDTAMFQGEVRDNHKTSSENQLKILDIQKEISENQQLISENQRNIVDLLKQRQLP